MKVISRLISLFSAQFLKPVKHLRFAPSWFGCRSYCRSLFQSFAHHLNVRMCVNERRLDVGVSENGLDDGQRVFGLEQVHRFTVAERMRRDSLRQPIGHNTCSVLPKDVPNTGSGQRLALPIEKERCAMPVIGIQSSLIDVFAQQFGGGGQQRDDAPLPSLTHDGYVRRRYQPKVCWREIAEFLHSQSGVVKQGEQCCITPSVHRGQVGPRQNLRHAFWCQMTHDLSRLSAFASECQNALTLLQTFGVMALCVPKQRTDRRQPMIA